MHNKRQRLFILAGVIILVLMVPVYMVLKNEAHLSNTDHEFKFRISPYDPYDPVRGKYIRLRYQLEQYIETTDDFSKGDLAHVVVETDKEGWAYYRSAQKEIPATTNYFSAPVRYAHKNSVQVELSFDRYFLNENLAPLAESEYDNITRENDSSFYAVVTIKNGEALLKEVYYRNQSYREYLHKLAAEAELASE